MTMDASRFLGLNGYRGTGKPCWYPLMIYLLFLIILSQLITTIDGSSIETIKDKGGGNGIGGGDEGELNSNNYHYDYKSSTMSTSISPWERQSSQPRFHVGEWGDCIGTCGTGIRSRTILCRISLDFSRMLSTVPDEECILETKPNDSEECPLPSCSIDPEANSYLSGPVGESAALISTKASQLSPKYSWRVSGLTECTATCLGGTQEEMIQCIRDHDQMVVSHYLCNIDDKPDSITRTCNDHPCPPRWNMSDFGSCSKPCGTGIQTREVNCIHEVIRGSENTLIVSNDLCTEPKPLEERVCNDFDCPIPVKPNRPEDKWSIGTINNNNNDIIDNQCSGPNCLPIKPTKGKRKCNKESRNGSLVSSRKCNKNKNGQCKCRTAEAGEARNTFVQTLAEKKVSLKVGGTAFLFEGTILKIRCPRRKDENGLLPEIFWTKNELPVDYTERISLTRSGALKIGPLNFDDSGNYSCSHGTIRLSTNIKIVPRKKSKPMFEDNSESPVFNSGTERRSDLLVDSFGIGASGDRIDYKIKIKPEPPYEVSSTGAKSSLLELSSLINKMNIREDPEVSGGTSKINLLQSRLSKERTVKGKMDLNNDLEGVGGWIDSGSGKDSRITYYADQQSSNQPPSLAHHARHHQHQSTGRREKSSTGSEVKRKTKRVKSWEWSQNGEPELKPDSLTDSSSIPDLGDSQSPSSSKSNSSSIDNSIYGRTRFRSGDGIQPIDLTEGKLEWLLSPWSNCSQPCGSFGLQVRARKCIIKRLDRFEETSDATCVKNGLDSPEVMRNCFFECPKWVSASWGECSKCVDFGLGKQFRTVSCSLSNNKSLPGSECETKKYPETSQTCPNVDCRPMWSASEWSMCSGVCKQEGTQERTVNCVWLADQSSQADNCDKSKMPAATRKCIVICDSKQSDCLNASFLCKYAKPDSCGHPVFRSSCCKSCRDSDFISKKR